MSGIDLPDGAKIRKGAPEHDRQGRRGRTAASIPDGYQETVDAIASQGRDAAGRHLGRPTSSA